MGIVTRGVLITVFLLFSQVSYSEVLKTSWMQEKGHHEQFCLAGINAKDHSHPGPRSKNIIYVPDDAATIQDAVNMAGGGDTIMISGGIYRGEGNRDVLIDGKDLTVIGVNDTRVVIIDCDGSKSEPHRAFTFSDTTQAKLMNVTIRNGYQTGTWDFGGAVLIQNGKADLENCHFENNVAYSGGAVGYSYGDSCQVDDCTFFNNHATTGSGGAIVTDG